MSALERWESFRLSLWCRLRIGETASEKLVNKNLETGTIEVEVESYTILNKAKELPIQVEEMGWILTKKLGCAIATLIWQSANTENYAYALQVYSCHS